LIGRKKKEDKKGFYAWELPVNETGGSSWTLQEMRAKESRLQYHLMKTTSWLNNNLFYEPVLQIFDDDILLRFNPNRSAGHYIIVDLNICHYQTICMELQGDINSDDLNTLCAAIDIPNPEPLIHKKKQVGWRLVTREKSLSAAQGAPLREVGKKNRDVKWQRVWLSAANHLRFLGWEFCFPYSKGYIPGYVFYKPY